MNKRPMISGPEKSPVKGGAARQLVVFLHGWGADGNDLISLAEPWSEVLPHAHFISPHAADVCDANPAGRPWFSFQGRAPAEIAVAPAAASLIITRPPAPPCTPLPRLDAAPAAAEAAPPAGDAARPPGVFMTKK